MNTLNEEELLELKRQLNVKIERRKRIEAGRKPMAFFHMFVGAIAVVVAIATPGGLAAFPFVLPALMLGSLFFVLGLVYMVIPTDWLMK